MGARGVLSLKLFYFQKEGIPSFKNYNITRASQVAVLVKNLLVNAKETWVQFLGWEDPLEEEMTTYSSILAWRIPWTEEPIGLQSIGS